MATPNTYLLLDRLELTTFFSASVLRKENYHFIITGVRQSCQLHVESLPCLRHVTNRLGAKGACKPGDL